jgi:hypothetical protein
MAGCRAARYGPPSGAPEGRALNGRDQKRHPGNHRQSDAGAGDGRQYSVHRNRKQHQAARAREQLRGDERRSGAPGLDQGRQENVAFGLDAELAYADVRQGAIEHLGHQEDSKDQDLLTSHLRWALARLHPQNPLQSPALGAESPRRPRLKPPCQPSRLRTCHRWRRREASTSDLEALPATCVVSYTQAEALQFLPRVLTRSSVAGSDHACGRRGAATRLPSDRLSRRAAHAARTDHRCTGRRLAGI